MASTALVHATTHHDVEIDLLELRTALGRAPTRGDVEREASNRILRGEAAFDQTFSTRWRVG